MVVLLAVVGAGVGCGGNGEGAMWHQPIARVNDTVFDMRYYVNMLRLYGAGQGSDPTADFQLAYNLVTVIQNNELVRQEAEKHGITVSQTEVQEEIKSYLNFDPDEESTDEFNQRIDAALRGIHLSRAEFEEMFIMPMLLQQKLQEHIGNQKYPEGQLFQHVNVQAMLLGTQEQASEAKSKWEGGEAFDELVSEFSPLRHYDSHEWLPSGIESSVFDGFAFAEGSENVGISGPMRDTTYSTEGGYWLIMVLGKENRTLSDDNRSTLVSDAFREWFQNAPNAEGIRVESYLDYSRINWALDHL
jgi:hypothetical protein